MGVPIPHNPGKEAGNYDRQIAELKRQIAQIMELIGKAGSVDMNAIGRKFISIEFFNQIFAIHGKTEEPEETEEVEATEVTEEGEGGEEEESDIIKPNTIAEVGSIEAKAGFWTEQYVSALGKGSGSGGGGGGGAGALYECADVKRDGNKVYGATTGKVLMYGADGFWYAGEAGGVDMNVVWAALASADASKKIDNSHLNLSTFFTGLANSGSQLSITIGGVNKLLTVAYATSAGSATNATNAINATNATNSSYCNTTADATSTLYMLGVTSGALTTLKRNTSMQSVGNRLIGDGTNLYLGTSENSGWVYVQDMCSQNGSSYWKISQNGNATFANVLSNGYVTALSDIHKKDIVNDFCLDIDEIALARLIQFTWKDGHDKDLHAGGIAQEWQKILPEAVHESDDGTLSMDYGVIGMVSSVSLARKVVEQQKKIEYLGEQISKIQKYLNL